MWSNFHLKYELINNLHGLIDVEIYFLEYNLTYHIHKNNIFSFIYVESNHTIKIYKYLTEKEEILLVIFLLID